jgi:hypothetical protein
LFFGRTFIARFSRNPQANCAATGTAAWGEFAFNCRDFVSDEHFERVGMATVGDDLIYTFRVKAPGP